MKEVCIALFWLPSISGRSKDCIYCKYVQSLNMGSEQKCVIHGHSVAFYSLWYLRNQVAISPASTGNFRQSVLVGFQKSILDLHTPLFSIFSSKNLDTSEVLQHPDIETTKNLSKAQDSLGTYTPLRSIFKYAHVCIHIYLHIYIYIYT